MTIEELAEKVAKMRQAQNDYFRLRTGSVLEKARKLEREVDLILSEIVKSKSLFEDPND